ncbi:MAG: hypothetical protein AAFP13_15560 [Pseudomonadota bacterium]
MRLQTLVAGLALTLTGLAATAQDATGAADAPTLALELNRATATAEGACQVIFFGQNGLDQDFAEVEWRLAVFDAEGVFKNLLALPLGALGPGKRRVVQYNLPFACAELSDIIVNEVSKCTLASGGESEACLTDLTVTSRTDIAFGL